MEEESNAGPSLTAHEEDTILYDVSLQVEWPLVKEVVNGLEGQQPYAPYTSVTYMGTSALRSLRGAAKAVGFPVKTGTSCTVADDLVNLINSEGSWHIARSPDGCLIAVLQDNCLEIRSQKEEYNVIVGRCAFSKDQHPQWRRVAWSQHSTTVAFSDSDGVIHVCDIRGMLLFSFRGQLVAEERDFFDHTVSVCSLVFIGNEVVQKHKEDSLHLLIVSYNGVATCLEINSAHPGGYKVLFQFDFSVSHTSGVSCVLYHKDHSMVIVGGCTGYAVDDAAVPKATKYGITVWRLLSEEPFLKSLDVFLDSMLNARPGFLRRLSTVPAGIGKKFRKKTIDGVYVMTLSPCHRFLAAVHFKGDLSLWEVPSFRLKRSWTSIEQPFCEVQNGDDNPLASSNKLKSHPLLQNAVDCKWWNDSSIILVRYHGSLAVFRVTKGSLENLFGGQCEWLEPAPRITFCKDEDFLALECEVQVRSLKRQREDSGDAQKEDENEYDPFLDDSDGEDSPTLVQRWKNHSKSAMYQLTEMEYFCPPHKRTKLSTKSYRLISVTKTTPEKLFEKKLEDEEYGEALALAQRYNLDGDRVFQRQWRKSPVSLASIQDYLSKVTKRSWVLHECCERVPEELDAARELLKFALQVTDIDKIVGNNSAGEISDSDSDFEEYEGFDVEEQRRQEIRQRDKFVRKWSSQIDFENLTLQQKETIRTRKKVFKYLDRLSTYEYLLGGYDAARERYSSEKYATFRHQDVGTTALGYARNCDWKAVDTLLTFHGDELREHRLPLLSNFPKTFPPSEYKSLLPVINQDGTVGSWPEVKHRDPEDWCEKQELAHAVTPLTQPEDPFDDFYRENPTLVQFRTPTPMAENVKNWFLHEAVEIDQDARDIESALELLKIGTEHYVEGLEVLTKDFKTLEILIYECDYDPGLTLAGLQEKSKLEQLKMLIEKSPREMYIKNFYRWAIPFLKACDDIESASEIFRTYVTEMAEEDLTLPTLLFASFLQQKTMPTEICTLENMVKLALDSIYTDSVSHQLNFVQQIYGVLVKVDKQILGRVAGDAIGQINSLENHIYACTMLASHDVKVTPFNIKEVENDRLKVQKLLVRLSRTAGARQPPLNKNEWTHLLKDMLQLCERVFSKTCGLEEAVCLEVYVESLLTSGNINNFQIAGERMMRAAEEEHETSRRRIYAAPQKLSYLTSVEQVIKASQEYFDASTPTSDDNMLSLARECLLLITDRPESVRERLDLIEGVVLLQRFSVQKLPLQVRLTEDRLSLIQKAVDVDNEAYRKTEPLLRLAMLLRACSSDKNERKGKVLVIIVEKALSLNDWESAYCLCQELISMPYGPAWEVCFKLACCDEFQNITGKRDILGFVACHSDGSKLALVMQKICILNRLVLQEAVARQEAPSLENGEAQQETIDATTKSLPSVGEEHANPLNKLMHSSAKYLSPSKMLETTAQGTKAVLSATGSVLSAASSTTKAVLSNVGNAQWWKNRIDDTLSIIPIPDADVASLDLCPANDLLNTDFEYQGCPEFYSDVIDNSVSKYGLLTNEGRFVLPNEAVINQAHLRALQLEELTSEMVLEGTEENNRCLEKLVDSVTPYDFALGIGYLCAFAEPERAFQCLQKFPVSALSIQLGLYYFSLRFLRERGDAENSFSKSVLYDVPPVMLIKHSLEIVDSVEFESDARMQMIASYMVQLKEQMFDFAQGEKLQKLGRGIDLGRFTKDFEYRQETILGLAMTIEVEQYKLAVSLAHRSGTDLWLVLITHLEFLFTECHEQLDCTALRDRIETMNMIPELVTKPDRFFERMDKYVYPFIEGKDHERLVSYFTLLAECEKKATTFTSMHDMCQISPSNHVKMLKKIKSVAQNLDYKALVTNSDGTTTEKGPGGILSLLKPVLNTSNVAMFAKMIPNIQYSDFTVTASSLYLEVAKEIIWKEPPNVADKTGDVVNWTARYESCVSFLKMCSPNDFLSFFEELLLTSECVKLLSIPTRQGLIKRGVKFCKMQATRERRNQLDSSILQTGQSFNTVLQAFIRMMKHLDSYSTSFIANLVKNATTDQNMENYLKLYDISMSNSEKILNLASTMLCDGCSPAFVQGFLAVVPGNKRTCADVMRKSIEDIVNDFSSSIILKQSEIFNRLTVIVKTVSEHERANGKIFNSNQVITQLRPFCGDADIDAKLRVDILQLLEDRFELEDSEVRMLLLHRTRAVVRDGWSEAVREKYLGSECVTDDTNRFDLFQKLLASDDANIRKLRSLKTLLEIWPEFDKAEMQTECWRKLLLSFATRDQEGGKEIIEVVKKLRQKLPEDTIKDVFSKLIQVGSTFFAIKLALLSDYPGMREDLLSAMNGVTRLGPSQCDEELLLLMLEKSIAVHSVGTMYFAKISEYLVSGDCPDAEGHVDRLARQLQDLGHMPEAGTLLLKFRGTHPALRTFNNAFSSLKRWLDS